MALTPRSRFKYQQALAQQMGQDAASTAPVQHWTQGLARMLQGGLSGYLMNKAQQGEAELDEARRRTMAQALGAGNPDAAIGILAQNPETADMGAQLGFQRMFREQEAVKPVALGNRLINPTTGEVIFEAPADMETAVVGNSLVNKRTGEVIYQGQREAPQETFGAPVQVIGPDGQPMFVLPGNRGSLRPVEGFQPPPRTAAWQIDPENPNVQVNVQTGERKPMPAPRAPTEGQANAALFANRIEAANEVLNRLEGVGTSAGQRALSALPGVGNFMVSDDFQMFDQARRDFINAVLRRESGAVISNEEFANAEQQYFPQPGDSPAVIAQKRRNREIALTGIRNAAGPAYRAREGVTSPEELSDEEILQGLSGQ